MDDQFRVKELRIDAVYNFKILSHAIYREFFQLKKVKISLEKN